MRYCNGAVLLHRRIIEWEWYQDVNVKVVFLHLLLVVNWKDARWRNVVIKRTQVLTSLQKIADQTGLSLKQVRTAIGKLKSSNEITTCRAHNALLITISNYDQYQVIQQREGTVGAGKGQQMNKTNKDKYTIELSEKVQHAFAVGGWNPLPLAANALCEKYDDEWVLEAFLRAVEKCGENPSVSYVKAILQNFEKNGGIRNNGKTKRYKKSTTTTSVKQRSKFASHPAGKK